MEIEDADVVAQWLSAKQGQKVYIRVPKGQPGKLVERPEQNAVMVLTQDKEKSVGRKDVPSELSKSTDHWRSVMSNGLEALMMFSIPTVLNP